MWWHFFRAAENGRHRKEFPEFHSRPRGAVQVRLKAFTTISMSSAHVSSRDRLIFIFYFRTNSQQSRLMLICKDYFRSIPVLCFCRIVSMVMTLREWAQKSLAEGTERPDSFLERFRGPANTDLQAPPSRFSHTHTGSETENEVRHSRPT